MQQEFKSEVITCGSALANLYTVPVGRSAIVKAVSATNIYGVASGTASLAVNDGATTVSLASLISVPTGSSVNLLSETLYMSAGESLKVNSSIDAIRFTRNTILTDTTVHPLGAGSAISGIVYFNSTYIAYGTRTGSGLIATSTDGVTWTVRAFPVSTTINDVAYGNGVWVAVTSTNSFVYTSTDLITWTARAQPDAVALNSVAYGNSKWVACGASGKVITATDPTSTWTDNASATTAASSNAINSLCYDTTIGIWVAAVATTAVITATDPTSTWTVRATALACTALASNGTCFIAVSGASCWRSTDGITWVAVTISSLTIGSNKRSLAYGNGRFVLVGSSFNSATASVVASMSTNGITWNSGNPDITGFGSGGTTTVNGVVGVATTTASAYGSAGWITHNTTGSISLGLTDWTTTYATSHAYVASIIEVY